MADSKASYGNNYVAGEVNVERNYLLNGQCLETRWLHLSEITFNNEDGMKYRVFLTAI